MVRVAVVGHVEWAEFARVPHVPEPGEIVHASERWEEPAGGGAVAAVQLARLAGAARFFTALGDDALGHRAAGALEALGVQVEAAFRPEAQRRVFVHLDAHGERTITVIGDRMGPRGDDPLPWAALADCDAVYFTAGDREALRAARAARVLTATPRAMEVLASAGVRLDALVGSARDRGEVYRAGDLAPAPALVVQTEGADGGRWFRSTGEAGRYPAASLPGPAVDAYGAGDSFAAGLTFALGSGMALAEALGLAARCGASCLAGKGPFAGQLDLRDGR
jgi:ribokinase